MELEAKSMFKFLGIHWGQFPEKWELKNAREISESRQKNLITDGAHVEGMSGMTCVIPAWKIAEVLDMPALKKQRESLANSAFSPQPRAESAKVDASAENPNHKEDFTALLDAAARKPKSGDQTS